MISHYSIILLISSTFFTVLLKLGDRSLLSQKTYQVLGECQKYGGDEPLVIPVKGPQAMFPALVTADNFPLFPFTDQFNTGVEINPANKVVR